MNKIETEFDNNDDIKTIEYKIVAECKSMFSTFYSRLADETLNKEPFLTTKNKNKFYDEDFRSLMADNFDFSVIKNSNFKQVNNKNKQAYFNFVNSEIINRFKKMETFYYNQVEKLIKTLSENTTN